MSELWTGRAAPIILLPGGEMDDRLLDLAEAWTRCWLLGPALWLRCEGFGQQPEDLPSYARDAEPPRIRAIVIGRNGRREIDLFEQLGRREIDLLRLVTVRSVFFHQAFHQAQDRVLDVLDEFVNVSRPFRQKLESGPIGTRIVKINLVFASSGVGGGPPVNLIEHGWDANIVVSPEDRPTATSFDSFIRESDPHRLDGFVLSNIATAAGLWAGIDKSIYEMDEFNKIGNDNVACIRTFVRGVFADDLLLQIASNALEIALQPTDELLVQVDDERGLQVLSAARNDDVTTEMVSEALKLDEGRLAYTPPPGLQELEQRTIGFWSQLFHFWKFAWDKIVSLPRWVLDGIRVTWSRRVTQIFQGNKGAARVDIGYGGWLSKQDRQLVLDGSGLEARKADLLVELERPVKLTEQERFPQLWRGLRDMCFGVLDGTRLPDGIAIPSLTGDKTSKRRLVLGDARYVVPAPSDEWTSGGGELTIAARNADSEVSTLDPMSLNRIDRARQSLERLVERRESRIEQLESQLEQSETEVQDIQEKREECEFELIEARSDVDFAMSDDESAQGKIDELSEQLDRLSSDFSRAQLRSQSARGRLEALETQLVTARDDLSSLLEWSGRVQGSFAAKLTRRLAEEEEQLQSDIASTRTWLKEDGAFPSDLANELRARFMASVRNGFYVVLIAVGLIAVLREFETLVEYLPFLAWPIWVWALIGLGVWLIVLFVALISYYRSWSEAKFHLEQQRNRIDQLTSGVHQVRREQVRLSALRTPLQQFFDVLALGIHQPWLVAPDVRGSTGIRPPIDSLAASLRLAEPRSTEKSIEQRSLEGDALKNIVHEGWRYEAYMQLCAAAQQVAGLPVDYLNPENTDSNAHAMRKLREVLNDPRAAQTSGLRKLRNVLSYVQTELLPEKHPRVRDIEPDRLAGLEVGSELLPEPDVDLIPWDEHLGEVLRTGTSWSPIVFRPEIIPTGATTQFKTYAFGPERLQQSFEVLTADSRFFGVSDPGSRPIELVVRMDISPWRPATDFWVFSGDQLPSSEAQVMEVEELIPRGRGLFAT